MDSTLTSLVDYYGQVMAGRAGLELSMACAEQLERSLLDYGLESLHAVDRYLLVVHGTQEGIPTIAYANTIMVTAIYVGEVVRRGAPSTEYRWGRTQEDVTSAVTEHHSLSDMSDVVLLSTTTGTVWAPTDCVLRRIRHGTGAPSAHALAVKAIRRAWGAAEHARERGK